MRATLPAGAACVVKAGHLVDAHSVRFYAPDSEQAGLLARQQEIENLQREIKAQQLIADQARAAVARAEVAWQQVSQSIAPARQRVAEVTRRVHDIQLEHSRLQQQAEQSGERASRLRQDLEEIAANEEDLRATREEARPASKRWTRNWPSISRVSPTPRSKARPWPPRPRPLAPGCANWSAPRRRRNSPNAASRSASLTCSATASWPPIKASAPMSNSNSSRPTWPSWTPRPRRPACRTRWNCAPSARTRCRARARKWTIWRPCCAGPTRIA